jgi:hypothetical protein
LNVIEVTEAIADGTDPGLPRQPPAGTLTAATSGGTSFKQAEPALASVTINAG